MNFVNLWIVLELFFWDCLLSAAFSRRIHHRPFYYRQEIYNRTNPTKHHNWKTVNDPSCGIPLSESRIIGGRDAELGQFPWLVQIFTSVFGRPATFDCAGSILNSKFIISAGHCYGPLISISYIRVGEFDTSTNPDCDEFADVCAPPYTDYHSDEIIKHEHFGQPGYLNNDIALIRIKEVIEFNDFVRPICLPFGLHREYDPGKIVEVAGWGVKVQHYSPDGQVINKPTQILQKLNLPVISSHRCGGALKLPITDSQLCAGGIEGYDACAGDSGGPLMKYTTADNRTFHYFLVGVVSYGPTICAQKSVPGVYTKTEKFLDWILDHIY